MPKLPALFTLFVLSLSTSAHASVFALQYSGQLTDRHTAGMIFPEFISGTLTFDLAAATDIYPPTYSAEYKILEGKPDFVTGYIPANTGLNQDFVRVYDGNDPANPEPFYDGFNIYDASVVNGIRNSIFIAVETGGVDWLNSDSVTPFSFTDSQLNDRSYAVISSAMFWIGSDGDTYVRPLHEAYYDLDFAELTEVNVPIPNALLLILSAIAGLWTRKICVRHQ